MRKTVLAGVFAIVTVGVSPVLTPVPVGQAHAQGVVITEGHIATLKAALNLTAAQERHWGPVENALRALARHSAAGEEEQSDGWVQRTRRKVASVGASTAGLRRVMASARPLIRTLDSEQKQQAITLARSLGIHSIASAL
jgi:hypothetical protein